MSIRPRGFDYDAPDVRIASFRDAAASNVRAAGMLARAHAAEPHQLWRAAKSRELAEFRDERDRGHLRDATERLQRVNHGPHLGRDRLNGVVDGALEASDSICGVIDFVQIIESGGFLRE